MLDRRPEVWQEIETIENKVFNEETWGEHCLQTAHTVLLANCLCMSTYVCTPAETQCLQGEALQDHQMTP